MDDLKTKILAINRRNDISASEKNTLINEIYNSNIYGKSKSEKSKSEKSSLKEVSSKTKKKCKHYERNCDIQCFQCSLWFSCRLCHDEEVNDHRINRFNTQRCRCRVCGKEQGISSSCDECGIQFAKNFCGICRMWCDFEIYHCKDCGICRKGKQTAFVHCKSCDACMPSSHAEDGCKASVAGSSTNSRDAVCPICFEELFSSRKPWQQTPCGHRGHSHCIATARQKGLFQCPICKKSLFKMDWDEYQRQIDEHPMPEEYNEKTATIFCNDCGSTTKDIKLHFMGMRCASCKSFNTN